MRANGLANGEIVLEVHRRQGRVLRTESREVLGCLALGGDGFWRDQARPQLAFVSAEECAVDMFHQLPGAAG